MPITKKMFNILAEFNRSFLILTYILDGFLYLSRNAKTAN